MKHSIKNLLLLDFLILLLAQHCMTRSAKKLSRDFKYQFTYIKGVQDKAAYKGVQVFFNF